MSHNHRALSGIWRITLILAAYGLGAQAAAPGPVVRNIRYDRQPIFSAEDQARTPWLPLSWADRLHLDTRTRVIERELVFWEGQPLDHGALEESERKLRRTGFFGEVGIETVPVSPDSLDVVVRTREVWTTELSAAYERYEGQLLWSASLRERNFLGTARAIDIARAQNDDRSTWALGLADRQMLDGTYRGSIGVSDSDDGGATAWALERPFFRLGALWGGEIRYLHAGQRPRFYLDSASYVRPHIDLTTFDVSAMQRLHEGSTSVWRYGLGFRSYSQRVSEDSDLTVYQSDGGASSKAGLTAEFTESREERTPYVRLRRVTTQYAKLYYIDAMGQVEDFAIGSETGLDLGWATHSFGGSVSGLWLRATQDWIKNPGAQLFQLHAATDGLVTNDNAVDMRLVGSVLSHLHFGHGLRFAGSALGGTGSGMDRHRVFTLGIENGLRAASYREFAGDRILRGNVELRWVHEPGLLSLVTPGLTAFADVGAVWYERERDLRLEDMRGAVGLGLRIGFRQGSQFVPLRFDLAWPVLYDNDRQSPILSIGTGQVF